MELNNGDKNNAVKMYRQIVDKTKSIKDQKEMIETLQASNKKKQLNIDSLTILFGELLKVGIKESINVGIDGEIIKVTKMGKDFFILKELEVEKMH